MSDQLQQQQSDQSLDHIPLKWFIFSSLQKEFQRKQIESELFLESQISVPNQTFIRSKDQTNLNFLQNYAPALAGSLSAIVSTVAYILHYREVDKYYLQKQLETEALKQNNPRLANNLFESKGVGGSEYPFKQLSAPVKRLRIALCAGTFFIGAFAKAIGTYRANLQNMDELYYKAKYESLIAENKIPKNN